MIEVRYKDRLGNNLFQYAYGRTIAHQSGYQLKHQPLEGFKLDPAPGTTYENDPQIIDDCTTDIKHFERRKYVIDGWFQRISLYDLEKLKTYIQYQQPITAGKNNRQVIIHMRYGDYSDHNWVLPRTYHDRAIADFNPSVYTRYAMTEDIDNPMFKQLCADYDLIPIPKGSTIDDMRLMSSFQNIVISNSTFSWWGAWLSNASTVVCPRMGPIRRVDPNHDLCVPSWTWIDVPY